MYKGARVVRWPRSGACGTGRKEPCAVRAVSCESGRARTIVKKHHVVEIPQIRHFVLGSLILSKKVLFGADPDPGTRAGSSWIPERGDMDTQGRATSLIIAGTRVPIPSTKRTSKKPTSLVVPHGRRRRKSSARCLTETSACPCPHALNPDRLSSGRRTRGCRARRAVPGCISRN